MKFGLQLINKNGSRIGLLSGLPSNPLCSFETPLSLVVTKGGSVPHLTQDVFHQYFPVDIPICIPAQHFVDKVDVLLNFKKGVSSFSSLKNHPVCVTVQDSAEVTPSGFNDKSSVSLWGGTGRKRICPAKYISLIEIMKPDWYEILNDSDTPDDCSKKRIEKSIKYSLEFLRKCMILHNASEILQGIGIFAPLIGGNDMETRIKWSEKVAEMKVDGFSLLGFHQNGKSAEKVEFNKIHDLITASLSKLPVEKPRQALGAFNIISIIHLVENGIDIFDSSLPFLFAEEGKALCFPNTFKLSCESKDDNLHCTPEKDDDSYIGTKKLRLECENSHLPGSDTIKANKISVEVDLNDKRYFDSPDPLVPDCICYTCMTYSKSYIHHLLAVHEMLATVLLMIHNLSYWETFFKTIREVIKEDRLTDYKNMLLCHFNKAE